MQLHINLFKKNGYVYTYLIIMFKMWYKRTIINLKEHKSIHIQFPFITSSSRL